MLVLGKGGTRRGLCLSGMRPDAYCRRGLSVGGDNRDIDQFFATCYGGPFNRWQDVHPAVATAWAPLLGSTATLPTAIDEVVAASRMIATCAAFTPIGFPCCYLSYCRIASLPAPLFTGV